MRPCMKKVIKIHLSKSPCPFQVVTLENEAKSLFKGGIINSGERV